MAVVMALYFSLLAAGLSCLPGRQLGDTTGGRNRCVVGDLICASKVTIQDPCRGAHCDHGDRLDRVVGGVGVPCAVTTLHVLCAALSFAADPPSSPFEISLTISVTVTRRPVCQPLRMPTDLLSPARVPPPPSVPARAVPTIYVAFGGTLQ